MANIITQKNKTTKSLKQFCDILKSKRTSNRTSQNSNDYIPVIVWGDIAGKRIYFIDNGIKHFYTFSKFALTTLICKLHEHGIMECKVDTSSIIYETYKNQNTGKVKRIYRFK